MNHNIYAKERRAMLQIKCSDVSLGYDGRLICEHLNFEIEKGDYLSVVGDNGAGKSTLMKALLGLKNYDAGEITFNGRSKNYAIGYLPQQTEFQKDFPATVEEIVRSGNVSRLGAFPFYRRGEKAETYSNMKMMGVLHLARAPFSTLSGGQKQRVLLARALCAAKELLLLDEPTAGLDPEATEELYSLVSHLNSHLGVTVIMITHDIPAAMRYSTKILKMGPLPTFYSSPEEYAKTNDLPRRVNDNENI